MTSPFDGLTPDQILGGFRAGIRRAAGYTTREVVLDDGLRFVYLEGGNPTAPPLVLLHGIGANKDTFVPIARYLARDHRLIVPDLIGFGESSSPDDLDYSAHAQAERLQRFAKALGLGRVHVGGSSMGGHVAMSWAARFPQDVASLWLQGSGGAWSAPRGAAVLDALNGGPNVLLPQSVDDYRRLCDTVVHQPMPLPEPLLIALANDRIARHARERRVLEHITSDAIEPRLEAVAGGLQTPTLIVWGRHDRIVHPDSAAVLQRLLPRSEVVMLDDVGHLPAIEAPERVATDYQAFRATL